MMLRLGTSQMAGTPGPSTVPLTKYTSQLISDIDAEHHTTLTQQRKLRKRLRSACNTHCSRPASQPAYLDEGRATTPTRQLSETHRERTDAHQPDSFAQGVPMSPKANFACSDACPAANARCCMSHLRYQVIAKPDAACWTALVAGPHVYAFAALPNPSTVASPNVSGPNRPRPPWATWPFPFFFFVRGCSPILWYNGSYPTGTRPLVAFETQLKAKPWIKCPLVPLPLSVCLSVFADLLFARERGILPVYS